MGDKWDILEAVENLIADIVNRLERLDDLVAELRTVVLEDD